MRVPRDRIPRDSWRGKRLFPPTTLFQLSSWCSLKEMRQQAPLKKYRQDTENTLSKQDLLHIDLFKGEHD